MESARVSWQQGFEKNYSKIRSYPPDSELHVCTVAFLNIATVLHDFVFWSRSFHFPGYTNCIRVLSYI